MKYIILILLILTLLGLLVSTTPPEEELEQERYCEMVELFVASKGDKGWPDYEGTYAESCTTQKED